jgi:hypothetical protein
MVPFMSPRNVARRLALLVGIVVVALLLAACPGPTFVVQQYGGPQRPGESIAVLRVNGNEPTRLLVLDGQDVAAPIVEDGRLHIEVLPVRHTVEVANARLPSSAYAPISFNAEAGKVYRITFDGPGGTPRVHEVNREKDELGRDVTEPSQLAPQPAGPLPRLPAEVPPSPAPDAGE